VEQARIATAGLVAAIDQHIEYFHRISDLCEAGKIEEASALYWGKGAPAGAAMEAAASELMELETLALQESAATGAAKLRSARWTAILTNVLAILLGGAVVYIVRGITALLQRIAVDLAEGSQ
jgi:hypothetical protein